MTAARTIPRSVRRSSPSEAQRRAIDLDLDCPIMSSCSDHELAEDHGVAPAFVREARRERRLAIETPEIELLARELAQSLGMNDRPIGEVIAWALKAAIHESSLFDDPWHARDLLEMMRRRRRRAERAERAERGRQKAPGCT